MASSSDIALSISFKAEPSSGATSSGKEELVHSVTLSAVPLVSKKRVRVTALHASPQTLDLDTVGKIQAVAIRMVDAPDLTEKKVRVEITWADGTDQKIPLTDKGAIAIDGTESATTTVNHITAIKLSINANPATDKEPLVEVLFGGAK